MTNIIIKFTLVGLVAIILSGCASGPRFTAAPQPASGKALVYVYRKSSIVGAAGYDKIYVNDDYLADLHSGGYCTHEIPEGTNVFYVIPRASWIPLDIALLTNFQKTKYEKLRFDAEVGKTYYVNVYVAFAGHDMKLVEDVPGSKQISKLDLETDAK